MCTTKKEGMKYAPCYIGIKWPELSIRIPEWYQESEPLLETPKRTIHVNSVVLVRNWIPSHLDSMTTFRNSHITLRHFGTSECITSFVGWSDWVILSGSILFCYAVFLLLHSVLFMSAREYIQIILFYKWRYRHIIFTIGNIYHISFLWKYLRYLESLP